MTRLFALVLASSALPLSAHEVRPAVLQITEINSTEYEVRWKQPSAQTATLPLEPVFPSTCRRRDSRNALPVAGSIQQVFVLQCSTSLIGQSIAVAGLERTVTDVFVRLRRDGEESTFVLRPDLTSVTLGTDRALAPWQYIPIGIEHLLLGLDHLLFVICLIYLQPQFWNLVRAVTAFTVAHSLTLSLVAFEVVRLPQASVEAIIALSILWLVSEKFKQLDDSSTASRWQHSWLLVFVFGLIHGAGFAGFINEVGLPEGHAVFALLFFNIGIELAQLGVIALILALMSAFAYVRARLQAADATPVTEASSLVGNASWLAKAPLLAAGSIAAYWFIGRSFTIFGLT